MATRLQLRRDTAANWTTANPILLDGEMAVETDTGKFKVGDGTTAWTSLTYSSGIQGLPGADGATWYSDSVNPTTEGVDGDFFLNTTSYDIFKKVSGTWTLIGNIQAMPEGGSAGQVLSKIDGINFNSQWVDIATDFAALTDTPNAYTNAAGKMVVVNETENGLEYQEPFNVFDLAGTLEETFLTGEVTVFPVSLTGPGTGIITSEASYVDGLSYRVFQDGSSPDVTEATFTLDVPIDGDIRFFYKYVSEESGGNYYPYGRVKVNGITIYNSRNDINWTEAVVPVLAGTHTIQIAIVGGSWPRWGKIYIDKINIPAGLTYNQGIEEHSNIDSIVDNPDKILVSKVDGTGLEFIPKTTYMQNLSDGTLPTASEGYRGQIFTLLGGTGVADISYICQKDATDAYVWVAI